MSEIHQTLAGYPYRPNEKVEMQLEAFTFCISNLQAYKHTPIPHLIGRFGLTLDEAYQTVAKAEVYIKKNK